MYLLAKFGDNRSYRNGDVNSYIKYYMDTLENAELTAIICYAAGFLKSEIPIYSSKLQLDLAMYYPVLWCLGEHVHGTIMKVK